MLNLISRDRWVFAVPRDSTADLRYFGVSLAIAFGVSSPPHEQLALAS